MADKPPLSTTWFYPPVSYWMGRYRPDEIAALEEIGAAIRAARLRIPMSQRRLAQLCGLHQSNISRLEAGKAPTVRIARLARIIIVMQARLVLEPGSRRADTSRALLSDLHPSDSSAETGEPRALMRPRRITWATHCSQSPTAEPRALMRPRRITNEAFAGSARTGAWSLQSPEYRLKITAPLWPPSPMLFDSAWRMVIGVGSVTTHRSHSGS